MRVKFKGLDYLAVGMGWDLDTRVKVGKLWRINHGSPFHLLTDHFGYKVVRDPDYGSTVLSNPSDGSYVVLGSSGNFLCDKVYAKKHMVG